MRILLLIFSLLIFVSCSDYDESSIKSFIETNTVLKKLINDIIQENDWVLRRLKKEIADDGNKVQDLSFYSKAERIRNYSGNLIKFIHSIQDTILRSVSDSNNSDLNAASRKHSLGEVIPAQLKDSINNFIEIIKPYQAVNLDSVFSSERIAGSINLSLLLIELKSISLRVLTSENIVLNYLLKKIGEDDFTFEKLVPIVRVESNVVAEGQDYKAEISFFAVPVYTKMIKKITFDGKEMPIDSSGAAYISFPAKAGRFDQKGYAKKKWEGKVYLNIKGRDTVFSVTEEYIVRKKCN